MVDSPSLHGVLPMQKLSEYLRVAEAANYLGVAPNTLRNWGDDGKIESVRHPVNQYRLFRKRDLEKLLRRVAGKRHKSAK